MTRFNGDLLNSYHHSYVEKFADIKCYIDGVVVISGSISRRVFVANNGDEYLQSPPRLSIGSANCFNVFFEDDPLRYDNAYIIENGYGDNDLMAYVDRMFLSTYPRNCYWTIERFLDFNAPIYIRCGFRCNNVGLGEFVISDDGGCGVPVGGRENISYVGNYYGRYKAWSYDVCCGVIEVFNNYDWDGDIVEGAEVNLDDEDDEDTCICDNLFNLNSKLRSLL